MRTFTDVRGVEWSIELTVGRIDRIKDETGLDLLSVIDGSLSATMRADLSRVASALFLACEPVSPVERARRWLFVALAALLPARGRAWAWRRMGRRFRDGLAADAFEAGIHALTDALVDFFPSAPSRAVLRAMMQKIREIDASASLSARWEKSPPPTGSASESGSSPEPPASIPAT